MIVIYIFLTMLLNKIQTLEKGNPSMWALSIQHHIHQVQHHDFTKKLFFFFSFSFPFLFLRHHNLFWADCNSIIQEKLKQNAVPINLHCRINELDIWFHSNCQLFLSSPIPPTSHLRKKKNSFDRAYYLVQKPCTDRFLGKNLGQLFHQNIYKSAAEQISFLCKNKSAFKVWRLPVQMLHVHISWNMWNRPQMDPLQPWKV